MSGALETSQFPIHCACRDGDVVALVSMLQQLADPSHLSAEDTSYGWTPIHWAAHYGQLECVVRLVQMGCEVNSVTSRFNQTPTHTAAFGGHTDCVVWLTQAGADVNSQDFVGEAPIHKAARSGSVEVIQVLLIAGAKAHLRNASGQTAADLAHANGYHDCYRLVSKAQKLGNGIQGNGLHGNGEAVNVNGRKRLLTAMDGGYVKKARSDMNDNELVQSSGGEEQESMNTESTQELNSDNFSNGHHQPVPYLTNHTNPDPAKSLSPPPALTNQNTAQQRPLSDTCGSLHLNSSPSSCVSHRPSWWASTDCGGDFLHFGHYHGFGDTAEDMGAHVEHSYKQALSGSAWHLYH